MSDQTGDDATRAGDAPTDGSEQQDFPPAPSTNPLAIASVATAVGGLIIWPLAVLAIVLGVVALRQINERGEGGKRLANISIAVGVISLLITAVAIATKN